MDMRCFLYIEDDKLDIRNFGYVFSDICHVAITYCDDIDQLPRIKAEQSFDLVFADTHVSGIALEKFIAQFDEIPYVIVSNHTERKRWSKLDRPPQGILTKPLRKGDILQFCPNEGKHNKMDSYLAYFDEFSDNKAFQKEMMELLLEQLKTGAQEISQSFFQSDNHKLSLTLHMMIGKLASMGMYQSSQLAKALEGKLKKNEQLQPIEIRSMLGDIKKGISILHNALLS